MRILLIPLFACACVTGSETEESALMDDFEVGETDHHHCPGGDGDGAGYDTGGDPGPKPDRKVCTNPGQFPTIEECKRCCFYNNGHVDGWECRRKRTPAQREKCWREANETLAACNRQCEWDRPITTIGQSP